MAIRVGQERATLNLGPVESAPEISSGNTLRVSEVPRVPGVPAPRNGDRYSFVHVERHGSIVVALALVAGLALLLLRWRGLLATVGVALSLLLLLEFVVPALSRGDPPFSSRSWARSP